MKRHMEREEETKEKDGTYNLKKKEPSWFIFDD